MAGRGKRVIGVDPGSRVTGFGIVEDRGDGIHCLYSGAIRTVREKASSSESDLPGRLLTIFEGLKSVIEKFAPEIIAVESVFHSKNAQSALKLGHARGAALLAGATCGLECYEYPPRLIKKGLTGYGAATKDQVKKMVRLLLGPSFTGTGIKNLDATDALAAAIYHCHCRPWLKRTRTQKQLEEIYR